MRTGGPASPTLPIPVWNPPASRSPDGKRPDSRRGGKRRGSKGIRRHVGLPITETSRHAVRAQKRRGDSGTAQGIWRNRRDKPPLWKGRPWNLFQACSGFSQENGTGAHTLYRIYRFGRAILLLNRVKILKRGAMKRKKRKFHPILRRNKRREVISGHKSSPYGLTTEH